MVRDAPDSGRPEDNDLPKGSLEPQVKGIAMREAIASLMEREDEARDKIPIHLQHYLEESVLASSWYPEADHFELMEVIAGLYEQPGKDVWFWMGQNTASTDLRNLYRAMVQEGQPITTLKRFPKIWRLYRTSGHVRVQTIGTTKGLVRLYDYPFVTPKFARLLAGYLSEAITISGGKKVLVNPTSLGQKVGAPAIWAVSWR